MVGITFGNKHSYDDYGLILSSKSIEAAQVKTMTVEVVGGDGVLDYTEYFGTPKYKNRKIVFIFKKPETVEEQKINWSNLLNDLQGQKVDIILDEDNEFHYVGRIKLSYDRDKNITTYEFECDCEPYKIKNNDTIVEMNGSGTVLLNNLRKRVVPQIQTTSETELSFGDSIVNISAGTHLIPELELVAGTNEVQVTSSGITTFVYREGGF